MRAANSTSLVGQLNPAAFADALALCADLGVMAERDPEAVLYLFDSDFPFGDLVSHAQSIHVHTKIVDVARLDENALQHGGGVAERRSPGYVKFRFPGGINLIFSSFPVAEEDLVDPDGVAMRVPFVDHTGVDLRETPDEVKAAWSQVPSRALDHRWGHQYQGSPVYGCHAEVKEKHWIYPPGGPADWRRPTEFPLGPLTLHDDYMGCDLRPIDPRHPRAWQAKQVVASACAPAPSPSANANPCGADTPCT
jgi:hypothetical protein